ncbi:MAG: bifunctional diaminohydroxyphosphoribosylaminopyrimidine deaminase/5-amino-6-(5-phosphoribosylamino)uracil reductase RibD [Gemmatales bacterium]|nr:bifunctional diaminohydroxyphosphoribosylaminopyrimidine deaminase/5-amino-6-(5-phosphoribosylamino)uracil reductase RibD [Gemmatales bacterium]MDW8221461.1 bifunctional diaminohydroxyphosphoribosylaminopyrimidine deaminase/5-amino-6-(5-phosphoribosylamino)uracil reductase RibD [Gemmatales bacterium]
MDEPFMRRALELAQRGEGYVEPNPLVGAVIVRDGQVVGEGAHECFGGPHAEILALRQAGELARGATLYVTLEPCCHWGKTPPCTQAILHAGIRRVVAAIVDPFPEVSGKGLAELRQAGVVVEVGLLACEARELNAPYLKRLTRGRPWIIAKWAMSWDGKIATATGQSKWLSGEESRTLARQWRGKVDAVLVGVGTVLQDDPHLGPPADSPRLPQRIILDTHLRIPVESQLVRTARQIPVLIFHGPAASESKRQALVSAGCECVAVSLQQGRVSPAAVLDELGRRLVTKVLVEGGGAVLGSFFDIGEVDEVRVFLAPLLVGGQQAPTPLAGRGIEHLAAAWRLRLCSSQRIGSDILVIGKPAKADSAFPSESLATKPI